jgi:hypothetical protein
VDNVPPNGSSVNTRFRFFIEMSKVVFQQPFPDSHFTHSAPHHSMTRSPLEREPLRIGQVVTLDPRRDPLIVPPGQLVAAAARTRATAPRPTLPSGDLRAIRRKYAAGVPSR